MPMTVATPQPAQAAYTVPMCQPEWIAVAPFADTADHRFFPETQHSLNWGFKTFWQNNGGLAQFGFPVEEEHIELLPNDTMPRAVQRFERARFEYHPEFRGTPYEVELGRVGAERLNGPPDIFKPEPDASPGLADLPVLYFPQTRHNIDLFAYFWQEHGGVTLLGYPLSEAYGGLGDYYGRGVGSDLPPGQYRTVQWFERGRIEQVRSRTNALTEPMRGLFYTIHAPCRDPRTGLLA